MRVRDNDFGEILVNAVRYYHGKRTLESTPIMKIAGIYLNQIPYKYLAIIDNDCRKMTEYDFGDPQIDKPHWMRFWGMIRSEIARRNESILKE